MSGTEERSASRRWSRCSSFLQGMGSVLDLFGLFGGHRLASHEQDSDAQAIYSDFKAVGMDLTEAMACYESEQPVRRASRCSAATELIE